MGIIHLTDSTVNENLEKSRGLEGRGMPCRHEFHAFAATCVGSSVLPQVERDGGVPSYRPGPRERLGNPSRGARRRLIPRFIRVDSPTADRRPTPATTDPNRGCGKPNSSLTARSARCTIPPLGYTEYTNRYWLSAGTNFPLGRRQRMSTRSRGIEAGFPR